MAKKKIKPSSKKTAKTPKKKTIAPKKNTKLSNGEEGGLLVKVGGEELTVEDKKPTMMRRDDWEKLKKVFFISKFSNVVPFLKDQGIVEPERRRLGGNMQRATKGWAEEKRQIYEEQTLEIRQNFREQAEEYVREMFIPLKEAKQLTLNAILERLSTHRDMGPFGHFLKLGDLVQILNLIKTELGEPTSIGVSKNLHSHVDINKLLEYAEKTDQPVSARDLDEAIYGSGAFDELPELEIDGRKQE